MVTVNDVDDTPPTAYGDLYYTLHVILATLDNSQSI